MVLNIIERIRKSPSKDQATAHAFIIGIYGDNLVSQNNRFDHNLIIDTDESAFLIRGYGFSNLAQNNKIRDNIIYKTGVDPYDNEYNAGTGLLIQDEVGLGGNIFQHNLFYSDISGAMAVYVKDDLTYYTASLFNNQNGVDGNTIENNIDGDPLFIDFNLGNYIPQDNSPAVNVGIDTGIEFDYSLNPRFIGTAPDIGPYETGVLGPLPVDWSPLKIEKKDQTASLSWKTYTEENSQRFTIQRSKNSQNWQEIGQVNALGFSNQEHTYSFTDHSPYLGLNYYRIRQDDLDGHFQYSNLASANFRTLDHLQLARIDEYTIQVISEKSLDWSTIKFSLFNSNGEVVPVICNGSYIYLGNIPRNVYFLKVISAEETKFFSILK